MFASDYRFLLFLSAFYPHYPGKYGFGLRSKNGKGLPPCFSLPNYNKPMVTQTLYHRLSPTVKKCHKRPSFVQHHQQFATFNHSKLFDLSDSQRNYKSNNSQTPSLTFQTAYPSVRQQRSPLLNRCHKMQPFVIFRDTKQPLDNPRNNGKGPRSDQKYGYDFKSKNGKDPKSDQKYGYDFKSEKKLW
jgi:hypothetical protein